MKSWNKRQKAWLSVATALLVTTGASQAWAVAISTPVEGECHTTLFKYISKHTGTIMKLNSACQLDQVLEGGPACPDPDAVADIAASEAKAVDAIVDDCQSLCSLSGFACIGDQFCPPNGDATEVCTFGSGEAFDFTRMGFPGPYCDVLSASGTMSVPGDFGTCAMGVSENIADTVLDNIFGAAMAPLSDEAAKCLKAVAKTVPKSVTKMAGKVAKCRDTYLVEFEPALAPDSCAAVDPKVSSYLSKTLQKIRTKVEKSCTDAAVTSLSFCGQGVGGITSVEEAQDCLAALAEETSFSIELNRSYAPTSLINAAYPSTAAPACGDNQINQLPNPFSPNGEECDGADLGSCASCLPPGDVFECTCAETRRTRVFADGLNADLDNGWTGASHNSRTPDGAGFVSEVSGCDCTDFTGGACTGTTGDSVCNVSANTEPQCAQYVGNGTTCDQVGNGNGINDHDDCSICGAGSSNVGEFCTGDARYCVGGVNDADRCNYASDCPGGACNGKGRCEGGSFAGNGCVGNQQCGVCTAGAIGSPCSTNSHCGGGGVCNTTSKCVFSSCAGGVNDDAPCDTNADCSGGRCAETSDCGARCYDGDNNDMGPCWAQADCGAGEICRGGCDTNECIFTYNSAPLPLSSEGTSVCVLSRFHSNVTGTRDIVDGSHAINYELRSLVHYGGDQPASVPCPVCGGYCADSAPPRGTDGTRCDGTCTGPELECRFGPNKGQVCTNNGDCEDNLCGAMRCRFDEDCPNDATCSGAASPDCEGRPCRLDLSCSHGDAGGQACRIESLTAFGTTSSDCPPDNGNNQTQSGLAISWTPLTSGTVSLESPAPCNAMGFGNYDCNCVFGGGVTNAPNKCGPACTNPTNPDDIGRSCANFTVCVGGTEDGVSCDEDSDCGGGGTCSENPRVCGTGNVGSCSVQHCVGGESAGEVCASNAQCVNSSNVIDGSCDVDPCTVGGAPCSDGECIPDSCSTNGDCEMGVTCDDVCGGGICTPLCMERGVCDGGGRDGQYCALDKDCVGGGTCLGPDVEEGACAQGTFNHCDGKGWEFVSCSPPQVGTQLGCELDAMGNSGYPGGGYCRADITHCFVNDGLATGGGTATESYSVATFCIPASLSEPINSTAGLPGPGRIRQPATIVTNFDSLP